MIVATRVLGSDALYSDVFSTAAMKRGTVNRASWYCYMYTIIAPLELARNMLPDPDFYRLRFKLD